MATAALHLQIDDESVRRIIRQATVHHAWVHGAHTLTGAGMQSAAGVLFMDVEGRVLLVEPVHKPYWDLPGGQVEAGESPRAAAVREVREELGIFNPVVGRLLVVDWLPSIEGRPAGLRYVFGLRSVWWRGIPPGVTLQTDEIRSVAWCTPDEQAARQAEAPFLALRTAAARAALLAGTTLYLESGLEVVT